MRNKNKGAIRVGMNQERLNIIKTNMKLDTSGKQIFNDSAIAELHMLNLEGATSAKLAKT